MPLQPRLSIVIPYRDRPVHLRTLVPHLVAFFALAPGQGEIPYMITVVEQEPGLPFCAGVMRNIGFLLTQDRAEYVCFHDVDYLPLEADYSCPETPTCALWYGAEQRPIRPGRGGFAVQHVMESYFSGVILMKNAQFVAANGYSTRYWGWGLQDLDLARRLEAKGFRLIRNKGRFRALDHDHAGFKDDGTLIPLSQRNEALYNARWTEKTVPADADIEGLNTTRYEILARRPIFPNLAGGRVPIEQVTVRIPGPEAPA